MRHTQLGRLWHIRNRVSLRSVPRAHSLVGLIGSLLATVGTHGQSLRVSSASDLLVTDPCVFAELLEAARPAPVSAPDKARILAALPEEGEIRNLAVPLRQKVEALSRVLSAAQRQSVYEVKIISLPQAAIVLHARAILVISERTLSLLSAVELQAVVAHEIGHEYVWAEYEQAKTSTDHHQLQELELFCDAIAITMLHRLDIEASQLMRGIEKISRFNQERMGTAINESDYPTVAQRRNFARAVTTWLSRGSARTEACR